MTTSPSWYDLLDVSSIASGVEIRAAWKAAIGDLEPTDRRFQTLNKAAEVLLDPAARSSYDAALAAAEADEQAESESESDAHLDQAASVHAGSPPPADVPTVVPERRGRFVPGWLLAALAAAVLIVAGAAAAVFAQGGDSDAEDSASAAQTAAEQAIVPILSYDYRQLDQDRAAARSYLTADYRVEYDKTFTLIEQNAESVQPVVVAKLVSSGLERSGADRVKVVLFVDQETTNKQTSEPVVYQNYVTVTMQEVDGEWLVDQLDTQG